MYTDTSKLSGPKPSFYCRQRSTWTFWTVAQTIHNCLLLLPGHFYISQLKSTLSEMVKAFDLGYSYVRGVIILTDPNATIHLYAYHLNTIGLGKTMTYLSGGRPGKYAHWQESILPWQSYTGLCSVQVSDLSWTDNCSFSFITSLDWKGLTECNRKVHTIFPCSLKLDKIHYEGLLFSCPRRN